MEGLKFRVVEDNEDNSNIQDELQNQNVNTEDLEGQQTSDSNLDDEGQQDDNIGQDQDIELDDQKVLNYLKERYERQFESLDEVLTSNEKQDLPEDVKKLMEFGVENYIKINKDWDKEDSTSILREYYKQTKPHLDEEDIDYLLEENYSFDEEYDDEADIKKKKVALKQELFEAKKYLNDLKEQYKVDLGAKQLDVPSDYKEAFEFYNKYTEQEKVETELAQKKAEVFKSKTENLFSNDFKGFEFNLGDKKQYYKPSNVNEVKEAQSDISKIIANHLDDNGFLKDEHKYHKALAMFRDPDGFAKFFYEQGKADAASNVVSDIKNIDMSVRDIKDQHTTSSGTKIRVVNNDDFEGGIKIKKRN